MSVFHIRVALIEEKVGIKTHEHNTGLSLSNIFIRRHANYSWQNRWLKIQDDGETYQSMLSVQSQSE